jgi:hypothetical protein
MELRPSCEGDFLATIPGGETAGGMLLHDAGEEFKLLLEHGQGAGDGLNADGGAAGVVLGGAVTARGEEGAEEFTGLKRVESGLAELVAQGVQFIFGKLLELVHAPSDAGTCNLIAKKVAENPLR